MISKQQREKNLALFRARAVDQCGAAGARPSGGAPPGGQQPASRASHLQINTMPQAGADHWGRADRTELR